MNDAKKEVLKYLDLLSNKNAKEILKLILADFNSDDIALASSFGAEDQVLLDMIHKIKPSTDVFTLDTGRLPQQTYDLIQESQDKYARNFTFLVPDSLDLAGLLNTKGPNLFRKSVENRKECCFIRKVKPLQKKLKTLKVWICGLRQEQSPTRTDVKVIEWDEANGLIKLNPLFDWTEDEVWQYIKVENVPYNALHDMAYPSIGCQCCTRAIVEGEDARAGRWWWEEPETKECGLHLVDGKLVRAKDLNSEYESEK